MHVGAFTFEEEDHQQFALVIAQIVMPAVAEHPGWEIGRGFTGIPSGVTPGGGKGGGQQAEHAGEMAGKSHLGLQNGMLLCTTAE